MPYLPHFNSKASSYLGTQPTEVLEWVQRSIVELVNGLEHKSCEKHL